MFGIDELRREVEALRQEVARLQKAQMEPAKIDFPYGPPQSGFKFLDNGMSFYDLWRDTVPIQKAVQAILDHLGLKIERTPEQPATPEKFTLVKRAKK